MALTFSETFPDLDSEQLEIIREMPFCEKLQIIDELILQSRRTVMDRLREHYPHETPKKIRRRFATVWLGSSLATKVYGPEPEPPTIEIPIKTLWYVPPRKLPGASSEL